MVIVRKRVGISEIEVILQKHGIKQKDILVKELKTLPRSREKAPPAPEGGICLRKASLKYGISQATLSRMVKRKDVAIIARTKNWLYIDEKYLVEFLKQREKSSACY